MTSYRRARIIKEKDGTGTHFSWIKPCIIVFSRLFHLLFGVIRFFWYWFQRIFLVVLLCLLTVGLAWWLSKTPSLYRDWEPQDALLPTITWSGNTVRIDNIRNHTWISDIEFVPGYYSDVFNLDEIEKVHYIIVPFSDSDGPAHTMLSFSFSGGKNIVVSAELRKERGEVFDAMLGLMNEYELQYVIASETDSIKLRTHYRKNEVYMYPINTPKEKIQGLFRSMMIRADKLTREPEFYNTVWNNCTTTILEHTNSLREEKIIGGLHTLLPAHSDELVYDAGLLDTRLPLDDARVYYRIDELARTISGEQDYSRFIRKEVR